MEYPAAFPLNSASVATRTNQENTAMSPVTKTNRYTCNTPSQLARTICLLCLASTLTFAASAQALHSDLAEAVPPAASAAQHNVVRWSGTLPEAAGKTVTLRFAVYEEQTRGQALWSELQTVKVATDGRYSALLGAATEEGIPQTLFPSNEPRWIQVTPQASAEANLSGNEESESATAAPRTLFAAVPYAFKSMDSDTLAGRAAADYVTREDLQSAVVNTVQSAAQSAAIITHPTPDITGTGTAGYLPVWTSPTNFGNSLLVQSGSNVGIGVAPTTTLDVNGNITGRGTLYLPYSTAATTAAGGTSHSVQFGASSWSSATNAAVPQNFKWEAVPTANNTAAPSASLALLFGSGTTAPVPTGFSIAANGRITFAAGQTFPVTAGGGTITGVTAVSPLTGGGATGTVAVGLNLTALETSLNPVYARLAAANNFTSSATFAGPITGNSGNTMYAIQGNTSSGFGVYGYATGTNGWGVDGYSTGNGGIGVVGNATGNPNGASYPIGVYGHVLQGTAIKGVADEAVVGQAAVLGQTNGHSQVYTNFQADGLDAGVWGDVANSTVATGMAIAGTADNAYAGVFENNSATWPTLFVYNGGTAGKGSFSAMMVGNSAGSCGIGDGNFSCTGQIKSLVSTNSGERTVETYSVQSPENWMEDFGSGSLRSGSAIVTLDPSFAETVTANGDYHVFLTPRGDSKGLYVTNLTATSFEVRESGSGTSTLTFDYRIVAKRRGLETQRLTDVTERFKAETAAQQKRVKALKPTL
jgi:hypothetical protein